MSSARAARAWVVLRPGCLDRADRRHCGHDRLDHTPDPIYAPGPAHARGSHPLPREPAGRDRRHRAVLAPLRAGEEPRAQALLHAHDRGRDGPRRRLARAARGRGDRHERDERRLALPRADVHRPPLRSEPRGADHRRARGRRRGRTTTTSPRPCRGCPATSGRTPASSASLPPARAWRAGTIARIEGRHRGSGGNQLRAAVLGANDGLVSNLRICAWASPAPRRAATRS